MALPDFWLVETRLTEYNLAIERHIDKLNRIDAERELWRQGLSNLLVKRERHYAENEP